MIRVIFWLLMIGGVWAGPVSFLQDDALILSNNPESFTSPGLVYVGEMPSSLRVMYYHKNSHQKPLAYEVAIRNTGQTDARVSLLKGYSGPNPDGLFVGHKATEMFFKEGLAQNYETLELLSGELVSVLFHTAKPQHVISGFLKLVSDQASQIELRIRVVDPVLPHVAGLESDTGEQRYFSGTYLSNINQEVRFTTKMPLKELKIGHAPHVKDRHSSYRLKGNYGVVYDYQLELRNVFDYPKDVVVYFSPVGGMARANFIIDGQWRDTGLVDHRSDHYPVEVMRVPLAAFESRVISLETLPQPGAYYPVNLILTTDTPVYSAKREVFW